MKLNEMHQICPECGGPSFSDLILAEKKDACYNKVRSRYKVWPSAYASGALVQCRKKGAANWGNKSKTEEAVNPAQQAAIAISMKKAGKKPKAESQLDEKCWDTHKQVGMKNKGGRMVPNCIPKESMEEGMLNNPGEQSSPVAQAIIRRILLQRTDLLAKYGPNRVGDAVDDVADFVGNVDEIGSSDVSSWVKQVEQMLASMNEDSNPEYDDEAGMADNNLATLERAIDGIDELIQPGDNLPEWCQEKIAIAKSMLVTVWDYMKSEQEISNIDEDWQKVNKSDRTDGMSRKAVKAYRRENPGSKLKTAVTTKPSKLKKGSKAAKRRKSFCARMSGMKKARASAKTKRDPNSPINKALRRWNCESIEQLEQLVMIAEQQILEKKKSLKEAEKYPEPEQEVIDATRRARLERERELSGSEKIDARLAQQNAERQQYIQSGKFWIKTKDNNYLEGPFVGKQAANQGALDLLKRAPELKGNLLITAWGPDETPVNEAEISEEQLLAKELKKQLEMFKRGKDNELSNKPKDNDLGATPADKEVQKKGDKNK